MSTTTKTANIHARINRDIKEKSTAILDKLGISLTQFIELHLAHLVKEKAVQFELELLKDDIEENYIEVNNIEDFEKLIKFKK